MWCVLFVGVGRAAWHGKSPSGLAQIWALLLCSYVLYKWPPGINWLGLTVSTVFYTNTEIITNISIMLLSCRCYSKSRLESGTQENRVF